MTARRRCFLTASVLGAVLALGACGSGHADVSKPAGLLLHAQVQAVRESARAANRAEAEQRLVAIDSSVTKLRARGDLSASAASRIRAAADSVAAELVLIPLPTTTTTTVAPRPDRGPGDGHGPPGKGPGPGKRRGDQPGD
jgi:hypothetical protein